MNAPEPSGPGVEPGAEPDVEPGVEPIVVDARGRRCPLPVIDLARRMSDVALGSVVELLADDPAADTDVPAWCRLREQGYLGRGDRDGAAVHRVRRDR